MMTESDSSAATPSPDKTGAASDAAVVTPATPMPPVLQPESAPANSTGSSAGSEPTAKPGRMRPGNIPPRSPKRPLGFGVVKPGTARPNRMLWHIFVVATGLVLLLFTIMFKVTMPNADASPKLAEEFAKKSDNYSIRPPVGWAIRDRVPDTSLVIVPKGGKYKYPPLVTIIMDKNAQRFATYMQEYKSHVSFKEKTVKWLREDEDVIDGCHSARLEYEWMYDSGDGPPTKVHTLTYILDDRLRYYWITCACDAEEFNTYLAKFEACARSFKRLPIPPPEAKFPLILN